MCNQRVYKTLNVCTTGMTADESIIEEKGSSLHVELLNILWNRNTYIYK